MLNWPKSVRPLSLHQWYCWLVSFCSLFCSVVQYVWANKGKHNLVLQAHLDLFEWPGVPHHREDTCWSRSVVKGKPQSIATVRTVQHGQAQLLHSANISPFIEILSLFTGTKTSWKSEKANPLFVFCQWPGSHCSQAFSSHRCLPLDISVQYMPMAGGGLCSSSCWNVKE